MFEWTREKLRCEGGFIHRSFIGKLVGGVVKTGIRAVGVSGIPLVSQVARVASSFTSGGSRNRAFITARSAQLARGAEQLRSFRGPRLPESGPMDQNRAFGITPQDQLRDSLSFQSQDGTCPKGFHLNKAEYYLKSEGRVVPERSQCVKNRHRNPDNGRASRRAANRLIARKRHQDRIDDALSSLVKKSSRRSRTPKARPVGPLIVQN